MKIINDRDDFYHKVITLFTERYGEPTFKNDVESVFNEIGNIIVAKHTDSIQIYVYGDAIDYPCNIFTCYCIMTITGNSIFYYGSVDCIEGIICD